MSKKNNVYICIMAGGSGERFWPVSRRNMPKQFHSIISKKSLITETVERISGKFGYENIFVVVDKSLAKNVKTHLPKLPVKNIIMEPERKNTLSAISFFAMHVAKKLKSPEAVICTMPCDHMIENKPAFFEALDLAVVGALHDKLVLVGITPSYPATGYGYIKLGLDVVFDKRKYFKVERFVEKPNINKARQMCTGEKYLWNSGMFCWKAGVILDEIRKYEPGVYRRFDKHFSTIKRAYDGIKSTSIDYAILEKSKRIVVVKGDFVWDDLGSWLSVSSIGRKDSNGNSVFAEKFKGIDVKDCVIVSDGCNLVSAVGLSNLIVVSVKDAVLVCNMDRAQDVKKIVGMLKDDKSCKKYL